MLRKLYTRPPSLQEQYLKRSNNNFAHGYQLIKRYLSKISDDALFLKGASQRYLHCSRNTIFAHCVRSWTTNQPVASLRQEIHSAWNLYRFHWQCQNLATVIKDWESLRQQPTKQQRNLYIRYKFMILKGKCPGKPYLHVH